MKFVGRKAELERLRALLESASSGNGGFVVLQGEPGIGKTALMNELASLASSHNMEVFRGTCQEGSNFLPILDAFDSAGGVMHVFIFYNDGRLISCNMNEGFSDGVMFLEDITKEVKGAVKSGEEEKELVGLGFPMTIMIERGDYLTLGVTFTGPSAQLPGVKKRVQKVLFELEEENKDSFKKWDGNMRTMIGAVQKTNVLITQQLSIKEAIEQKDDQSKFEGIFKAIVTASREEPILLLLDDFQSADAGTIGLLSYISPKLAHCRMLIVASLRPPAPEAISEMLSKAAKTKGFATIELKRFTHHEVEEWLVANYPNNFPNEFSSELLSESDGTPYLMSEIMNSLASSKKIIKKGGVWSLASPIRLSEHLPKTIKDMFDKKLDGLTPVQEKVLTYASVLASEPSRSFDFAALGATLGIDEYELLDIIDQLSEKRLIFEIGDGIYRFDSEALRSLIYNRLTDGKRKGTHREIAEAIEKTFAQKSEPRLAFHYAEGDVPMKALSYNIIAGKAAMEKFDYLGALTCYDRANRFVANLDESQKGARVQLYSRLGEIYAALGQHDTSIECLNGALGMSWENADENEMGNIYWSLAEVMRERGDYTGAEDYYKRSCQIAGKYSNFRGLARGHLGLANAFVSSGNYDEAAKEINICIKEAGKVQDSETLGKADVCLGIMYFMSGDREKGGFHFDRGLGMLEQVGDLFEVARANYELGLAYKAMGDNVTSSNLLEKSASEFEKLNLTHRAELARLAMK